MALEDVGYCRFAKQLVQDFLQPFVLRSDNADFVNRAGIELYGNDPHGDRLLGHLGAGEDIAAVPRGLRNGAGQGLQIFVAGLEADKLFVAARQNFRRNAVTGIDADRSDSHGTAFAGCLVDVFRGIDWPGSRVPLALTCGALGRVADTFERICHLLCCHRGRMPGGSQ